MLNDKAKRLLRKAVKMMNGDRQDRLAQRWKLKRVIDANKERGRILIVESGRDCDGCEWRDRTHTIPATVTHYLACYTLRCDGADGPIWWNIDRPSAKHHYRASTRDLALEAFEDGHDHVLYSSL